ncbi:iron ABC transporter substrate-binding protein [Corynebacterium yudongzhengii]|uniref:Iron ABC transporter substrate-binding protein n=1 Tax=Corynebacterium yudongzhengii TaxID=2080740 RepID=A0A2U1T440_9CORY|nr:ABC transporter substrate-binding protein [Corynebacterium yudongzhengii]AWB82377.1 iron ABC transporter substrate-binding protein [Corynebacterium yudongzhengii]PWC00761.1 iron ABC transporter substrate-binding protein [Corynebacterium yudongzhengii]
MKIRHTAVAVLAASALALSACATGEDFEEQPNDTANSAENGSDSGSTEASAASDGETITLEDNHGTKEVPANPETVVATDNRAFEVLSEWGIELAAAPQPLVPFTVEDYKTSEDIVDIGNHREPDLEALTAVQPDLIVNGQRFTQYYDEISELNPDATIIEFEPRDGEPLDEELRRHTEALGKAFGHEEEAQQLIEDFDAAIERAREAYNGEDTVMAVNVSGGTIGYIAPGLGRTFGPIFDLLELNPALEVENASDDHQGDDISVEAIAQSNPDWVLVLDRDAGTNSRNEEGFVGAQTVIGESEALQNTTAISEDQVYYAPEDTYTNESIITYTEILNGIAEQMEQAQ